MNDYIIKTLFFHNMMFDLKGHIRSNKALYVYIFSSNNSSVKPLLSKPLYLFSLSRPSSLLLFYSLCLSTFSLSLILLLSLSFINPPPPTHTSALYPPYASLYFLFPSFFFSLFVALTYVLMDNFLSLFFYIT